MRGRTAAAAAAASMLLLAGAATAQWRDAPGGGWEAAQGYGRERFAGGAPGAGYGRGGYAPGGYGMRYGGAPGGDGGRPYGPGAGPGGYGGGGGGWRRGQVLPQPYRDAYVPDPGRYHLRAAPPGYGWVGDGRDAYLTQRSTGLVLDHVPGAYEPAPAWRRGGGRGRPR